MTILALSWSQTPNPGDIKFKILVKGPTGLYTCYYQFSFLYKCEEVEKTFENAPFVSHLYSAPLMSYLYSVPLVPYLNAAPSVTYFYTAPFVSLFCKYCFCVSCLFTFSLVSHLRICCSFVI